ncbi:hypothetical protein BDW72DRAFT_140351 [Aspergillus terricola var. indicus]
MAKCRYLARLYSHIPLSVICGVLAVHYNNGGKSPNIIGASQQPVPRSRTELKANASVNPEIRSTGVIKDLAPRLYKTMYRAFPLSTNAECVEILSEKRCRGAIYDIPLSA